MTDDQQELRELIDFLSSPRLEVIYDDHSCILSALQSASERDLTPANGERRSGRARWG
jgi:hypothetical protein